MKLSHQKRTLDLTTPQVMGVLNTTPDSFSDGGRLYEAQHLNLQSALQTARKMISEGAAVIDIGGESTRPGATPVSVDQEIERTIPVIEALRAESDIWISIDTSSAEVMRAAASAGADMINDVRALQQPDALQAAKETGLCICLMHMQGEPSTMQVQPFYENVVSEVESFLLSRVEACEFAGIAKDRLLLDVGFGFGKTLQHNLALLAALPKLAQRGYPLLVGLSRKRMAGELAGREVGQRLAASLGLALYALQKGARLLRVHDVAETVDIIKVYTAMQALEAKNYHI